MQIHQSAEDYLETILMLSQRMGKVRSIDVEMCIRDSPQVHCHLLPDHDLSHGGVRAGSHV